MGGCRCTFRGCDNASNNRPGMHFFHFPTKDAERCEKWIIFSNNLDYRDMDEKKLRNRNVCEEHFRIRMFMNIKKERLVRFAYPTLLKTKINGKVYDLEKFQDAKFPIEDMNIESEMDEEFDQFLVDDAENPLLHEVSRNDTKAVPENEQNFSLNEDNIGDIPIEFEENAKISPKKIVLTPVKFTAKKRTLPVEKEKVVMTPVMIKKPKPSPATAVKILNSTNLIKQVPVEPIEIIQSSITEPPVKSERSPPVKKPVRVESKPEDLEKIKKLTEERDKALKTQQNLKLEVRDAHSQINVLEQKVKMLQNQLSLAKEAAKPKSPVKKVTGTIATQTDPEKKETPKVKESPVANSGKPAPLTKPQLFNGIKRYVSNAMATLLKMEMFGNSEREWKADEKKISCEVMRLGKDVYEYFTDEWRLRLPSKSDVSTWLQDNADEDDDDLF
ncbi:uncharacterized protein LOC134834341 [Culicoides brevitarsis]|uniref:uncharacterized protein LOC134834341 n=1 Tax=Culicoides brevitarsis TaxID=469753 RepID=UPI00307BF6D5